MHSETPLGQFMFQQKLSEAAALSTAIVAAVVLAGFPWLRFDQFLTLEGDHFFLQVLAKQFSEGGGWNSNPALGFPDAMRLAYFPSFDVGHQLLLWLVTRVTPNYVTAIHLWYLASIVVLAISAFIAFRILNIPPWLGSLGALLFTISPYVAARSGGHDYLAMYWSVPLLAVLPLYLSNINGKVWLFFAGVIAGAAGGLYYAFFGMLFLTVSGAALSFVRMQWRYVLIAFSAAIATLTLVVATGYGVDFAAVLRGDYPQAARVASEQIHYGLPLAAALKEYGFVHFLNSRYAEYLAITRSPVNLLPPSEHAGYPGPLLTAVIFCAPAFTVLCTLGMKRPAFVSCREFFLLRLCGALIAVGIFFAIQGGYGYIFNLLIAPMIRAQVRIVPFLAFFAIAAVLIVVSAMWRGGLGAKCGGVALCLLTLTGLKSPAFFLSDRQTAFLQNEHTQQNLRSAAQTLEIIKTTQAQAILQLPNMQWPEIAPQKGFEAYEHQLLYLLDRPKSSLSWSYGGHRWQPSFRSLSFLLSLAHKSGEVGEAARALGFQAIVVEKRAYTSETYTHLMRGLADVESCLLYEDQFRVAYRLDGFCLQSVRWDYPDTFNFSSGRPELDLLLLGWHGAESNLVWSASRAARIVLPLKPNAKSLQIEISLFSRGGTALPLTIAVNGESVVESRSAQAVPNGMVRRLFDVALTHERSTPFAVIEFRTKEVIRPSEFGLPDQRALGIALHDVRVR